ncbi:MAG: SUMF1/EgtB/PvdO family nonheme iron enzyme [Hyphomicrobiales bacterium]
MPRNPSGEVPRIRPDVMEELQKLYTIDEHNGFEKRGGLYAFDGASKPGASPIEILIPHHDTLADSKLNSQLSQEFKTLNDMNSKNVQRVLALHTSGVFRKSPVLVLHNTGEEITDAYFGKLSQKDRQKLFLQLLNGMADLHNAEVLHGNITLSAVAQLTETGEGQLRHFGLPAGAIRTTGPEARPYLATGRETATAATRADDVHALGMIGYRLFMGEQAFHKHFVQQEDPKIAEKLWETRGSTALAPTGDQLGLGADDGARLAIVLKRMTGRENGFTYSSAVQPCEALGGKSREASPKSPNKRVMILATILLGMLGAVGGGLWLQNQAAAELFEARQLALSGCVAAQEEARALVARGDLAVTGPLQTFLDFTTAQATSPDSSPETIKSSCETMAAVTALGREEIALRTGLDKLDAEIATASDLRAAPSDEQLSSYQMFVTDLRADLATQKEALSGSGGDLQPLADLIQDANVTGQSAQLLAATQSSVGAAVSQLEEWDKTYDFGVLDPTAELTALRNDVENVENVTALRDTDATAVTLQGQFARAADSTARTAFEAALSPLLSAVEALPKEAITDLSGAEVPIPQFAEALDNLRVEARKQQEFAADALPERMQIWTTLNAQAIDISAGISQTAAQLLAALRNRENQLASTYATQTETLPEDQQDMRAALSSLEAVRAQIDDALFQQADGSLKTAQSALQAAASAAEARAKAETDIKTADDTFAASNLPEDVTAPARELLNQAQASFDTHAYQEASEKAQQALDRLTQIEQEAAALAQQRVAPRPARIGSTAEERAQALALCRAAPNGPRTAPNCEAAITNETARTVELVPFRIDRTEVSAADFSAFVQSQNYRTQAELAELVIADEPDGPAQLNGLGYTWNQPIGFGTTIANTPDFPVLNISALDAAKYCAWKHPLGRLPTEAEWEYTARGKSTSLFPQGLDANAGMEQLLQSPDASESGSLTAVTANPVQGPAGTMALAGNAREWVKTDTGFALKGGSFRSTNPVELRTAARVIADPSIAGVDYGFRCAQSLDVWEN